jgi:putative transposase
MPRTGRIAIIDVPHHITQRGNNRQDVFFVDDDRRGILLWTDPILFGTVFAIQEV